MICWIKDNGEMLTVPDDIFAEAITAGLDPHCVPWEDDMFQLLMDDREEFYRQVLR